jgi:hypothetical protein
MLPTTISCPHCDARLRLPREIPAGKKMACPRCQSTFQVPGDNAPGRKPAEDDLLYQLAADEKAQGRRPPVKDVSEQGEPDEPPRSRRPRKVREVEEDEEGEPEEPPRSKKRMRRKAHRGIAAGLYPLLVGFVASVLLLGLVLLLAQGQLKVPFLPLWIVTGIVFVVWMGALWKMTADDSNRLWLSAVLAALTFLAGWGLSYQIVEANRNGYLEASGLKAKVGEYVASGRFQRRQSPVIVGKVVVLERDGTANYRFDYMHYKITDALRPSSHSQVGTVVLIDWNRAAVGTYTNGSTAYQWSAQVQIIDFRQQAVIHAESFAGTPPPVLKSSRESGTGSKPDGEIVEWLDGLPRQALRS